MKNLTWHEGDVTADDRARLLGQRGCVVWFTGLSGSGKSTLARALERRLFDLGRAAYVLDGDNIRHGLNRDLGFGAIDREENIRRLGEVSALFADAGLIVITAFISPFRRDRDRARACAAPHPFIEIHLDTPLETCESRDPKGLYRKARAGDVAEFTGLTSPYEPPEHPDLVLNTEAVDPETCVARVLSLLEEKHIIP